MKEQEFIEKVGELTLDSDVNLKIEVPVYYAIDNEDSVIVDFESIREEFESKLDEISKLGK